MSGGTDGVGRVHRATSDDGTEIVGRVIGEGPPVVFLHGGMTDGEHAWNGLLPHITDHFTCYLPSTRGAGLSEEHDDLRPERNMEDLHAFIDSIGEPVGLVGHSTGGTFSFGAVQMGADVTALATYEPAVFELWEEGEDARRFEEGVTKMAEAASEGRLTDAARHLLSVFANDNELTVMEEEGHFEHAAQYVPVLLETLRQANQSTAPSPNDPAELATISIPIMLVYGSETTTAHADSIHYLDEHLSKSRVRKLDGLGHMAPELGEPAVADAFIEFFTEELN